ncbi:response regulator [Variovorax saccharolyticus]|uniref:response regulator n=1 Tax=Variovorax saccharolyticus TaxID=3053516 RepID=UPI00257538D5|nr:response regulator [Variovorax sp. J22R187]MDM0022637.1 response regulator [Variovorax sp. J22R187]
MTPENPTPAAVEPVNILLVDDEPVNLTVLETVLEDAGYRLIHASSGEQALLALMTHEFAVLVLDVNMPDMTGFELATLIKQRRKTAQVPIIFLTAYFNDEQHVAAGYGTGAVDYLHKPVNVDILRSKVAVFADLYRKERALQAANSALQGEVAERRSAQERLRLLNETLERRVLDRTTALRASESELREANRRKDEFLAILAHELRNPLAPVGYAVRLLRLKAAANPDVERATQLIDRQVKVMGRLIDDLMDVSRISQGKIELQRQRIAIAGVLHDAIEGVRPLIDEASHTLKVDLPAEELALHADATRLSQAFMNLIHNAAKYMDKGGRIDVGVQREASEVVVSFRDTGIGIATDRLDSIFEMFSQVETALSRSRGGLGIGLSLTRRLLELHGGSITARSAGHGQGSEFIVRLPLADAFEDAPMPAQGVTPAAKPAGTLRILVADDSRDCVETLTELLTALGHTVRGVFSGHEAMRAMKDFEPQLVLLDIGMPGLNGYDTCRAIRGQPGGARVVMCAVTGWGQPDDVRKATEAGFDEHLVKPVDPDALVALLSHARWSLPAKPTP